MLLICHNRLSNEKALSPYQKNVMSANIIHNEQRFKEKLTDLDESVDQKALHEYATMRRKKRWILDYLFQKDQREIYYVAVPQVDGGFMFVPINLLDRHVFK